MRPLHGISLEGLRARGGRARYGLSEQNVYVWRAKGIRLAMKMYTFRSQNVYVSGTKRIRLGQVPNSLPQATVLRCFILME